MTTHAMIDIETTDTCSTAMVLSVGAVKFDPFTDVQPREKTVWRPSLEEQLEAGRTSSEDTLEWWGKQDPEIRERAFTENDRVPAKDFFHELNKYLVGCDQIWCQGPQFDMVILEDLYSVFKHHTNWQYWQIRDSRTLFSLMPVDPRKAIQADLHDAGEDSYWQAVCVLQSFAHFGVLAR